MKKILFFLSIVLLTIATAFAQTATLSYQAVVRDSHNKFVRNTDIDVEVRISVESTERYYETRTAHTNQNGVVSFSIGDASRTSHTGDELVDITGWRNATISVTFHLADGDVTTNSPVSAVPYALEVNPALLPTVNDATLTIQKNNTDVGTFTANQGTDQTINITVPTCDSLSDCDLIKGILNRLDRLEQLNDSLARELDKMKPSLTVTASLDTVTICSGSSQPVTYTATFHNCSSSDYTILWKVNGTDSSNVTTPTLTFNAETAGNYEVVCTATRSDNSSVADTVNTHVEVDIHVPSFTATVNMLTVSLSDIVNTAYIQWTVDSVPVAFSGTSAEHTYAVADTITITATSATGCTFTKGLRLQPIAPTVTTDSVNTIAANTAKAYGTVTSDGGLPNTKRGMVYSTSDQNLKIGTNGVDSVMAEGTGKGNYSCNLKRLAPCTQYYVRAFAINDVDTAYGEVKDFTTVPFTCGSTLTDIDGNEYGTLLLGSQCWMKQNLRTTRFADGTEIPAGGLNNHSGARRYAPNSNLDTYGYLYNWDAAMNGSASSSANPSGVQGVCPDGWHLPSDAEWTQLTSFVASNSANVCDNNPLYIAKSLVSTEDWGAGAWGACSSVITNNTGFSVLPAGTWHVNGAAGHTGQGYFDGHTIFRTATGYEGNYVWTREFYAEYPYVDRTAIDKTNGLSVRCVLTCPTSSAYLPTISTVTLSITAATVSMTANVISDGGATVTERGVCWSTSQHPTTSSDHTASGSGIGAFSVIPTLAPGATYYVRAYATNSEGTAYGAEVTYVVPNLPTVTTTAVTDVTASTATTGGDVTADGGASVTARGVCWSTSPNPTIADNHTSDGSGTGSFTSNITGLSATTTYYARAYATNAGGTSYGSQVSFTTTDVLPQVTTSAVSNISGTTDITATCGGNVTDMGLDDVTARGVCWSTSQNPTVSDSHTTDGDGTGSLTSNITGLTAGATYYVRAYATNSAGTAYGNQESFTVPLIDGKSCPSAPTVTDHEGNVYATVQIGTYCWMRENLRTTTSPKTGTYLVNTAHLSTVNRSSFYGTKVAHWYMNDSTTYAPMGYGLLYNWCSAMDTANSNSYVEVPTPSNVGNNDYFSFNPSAPYRGICPAGWHLPSYSEWNTLRNNYSPDDLLASGNDWASSHSNATGFTALPAGYFGNGYASFQGAGTGNKTYFWSCTGGTDRAQALLLQNNQKNLSLTDKNYGMSVRCIKD